MTGWIKNILYNLKDFCWAGLVQSVHPKARQFYSFKNQTDFDHKWGQKEMIEFLSVEIFEITEWRLTGWLKYWHTGDYLLMIASVQQYQPASRHLQPARRFLVIWLMKTMLSAIPLSSSPHNSYLGTNFPFDPWWLLVMNIARSHSRWFIVGREVLLDLNIFIEAWTVNMNTSNWVISRLS